MRNKFLIACASGLAFSAGSAAHAQSIGTTAPAVVAKDPEYRPVPVRIGPFDLATGVDVAIDYDSNIYALPDNEVSDEILQIRPYASLNYSDGPVSVRVATSSIIRRFVDNETENSEGTTFEGEVAWSPAERETLALSASWQRAIEDRGDPEARNNASIGPRITEITTAGARYRRARGRLLFGVEGVLRKNDAVASFDDDRDFTSYSGRATAGYRVSGAAFATASFFVNRRDFRLEFTPGGIDRNSTTYGGRLGLEFEPGGLVEGNIGVGLFRNEPDDPTFDSRTGLSVTGQLRYAPTRRAYVILDVFSGDVATFRNGATSRTDSSIRLTWQQEVRHNLLASATAGYSREKFVGLGQSQETFVGRFEVEYLATRNLSLAATASYGERSSDIAFDEFNRFRGGLTARLRF